MGRGAGNTPTELIAQYMVSEHGYNYDMDVLLDIMDNYMDNIRSRCSWGYNTPYFVAGCYSAHVNNIAYLTQKNSIRSKDIRYILNKIGDQECKRYNYDLLESTYMEYLHSDIDDTEALAYIQKVLQGKDVLVLVPGFSVTKEQERIRSIAIDDDNTNSIRIAGFDGYSLSVNNNYAAESLELANVKKNPGKLNEEISSMLLDYKETRKKQTPISFVTDSRFSKIFSD